MIIPTPEISDANAYGVPAPGATIYHPPVTVGGVTYSGWHEFQGAALEYYSPALLDLICSLWADMLDPEADGSPTSLQTWIAGETARIITQAKRRGYQCYARMPCSLALENGPGTCEGCPDHEPPPEAA